MLRLLAPLLCLFILPSTCVRAQSASKKMPSVEEKTSGLEKKEGYFDVYYSHATGNIFLEVTRLGEDFLYVNSLAAGLGSNDIGLDRNQLGGSRVVQFHRVGTKVLLKQRNLDYRAVSDNPDEVNSVRDAFAESVIQGFKIVAKTKNRVLIDLTPMLISDAHGVADRLRRNKQGTYKVDASRSAIYLKRTKNFPKNSEFEATVTFTGRATGSQLRSVTPTSGSFSLRMHHSFVELPDAGYQPRKFDPRSGYYSRSYADYATPIDQPLVKRFITRHRLEKKDPSAKMSEPVEPIVYYLDRGAPEPIRSALIEGAGWWNEAFEAAGFTNAFQVKVLPADADPMDVRYNVINWVHRSTRGWSYGSSVTDPRTGEIIKGHVLLGSLRVRQDFLLAQGLIKAYENGNEADPRLLEMALARLRQLSAHEVGHTIGLAHNFSASTNDRASVMDYPHPYVTLKNGVVDFSQAYGVGIGEWDKRAIMYGYRVFPEGVKEQEELSNLLDDNDRLGLKYISDSDARPQGSANPGAHLWDNGADPVSEINRIMRLRRHALGELGMDNIPGGSPVSELEKVMVPVYLMHRYQVEAVAKLIGGYHYSYEVKGGYDSGGVRPVDGERQQAAIKALVSSVSPQALTLPDNLIGLIPPPAMGYSLNRESFKTRNGVGIDPLAMAETAADNSLTFLLHHHRLARIVEQQALFPEVVGDKNTLRVYLREIGDAIRQATTGNDYQQQIGQLVEKRYVAHLLQAAANEKASEQVRAGAMGELSRLRNMYDDLTNSTTAKGAHYLYLVTEIQQFMTDPSSVKVAPAMRLPDGSPIGCGGGH